MSFTSYSKLYKLNYDYLSGRYGVRFTEEPEKLMGDDARDKES